MSVERWIIDVKKKAEKNKEKEKGDDEWYNKETKFSPTCSITMVTPAVKHTIVKKRTAHFKRHQSNRFMRVGVSVFNNIEKYIFTNFALK